MDQPSQPDNVFYLLSEIV